VNDDRIKGVIFDLDGTLIDSFQAIYLSFRHTYEGLGLSPLSYEEVKGSIGYGLNYSFRDLLGEERVTQAVALFRKKYEEVYRSHTRLLADARTVVEDLYGRGTKLSVATNKLGRFAREIFRHFEMENFFVTIVGDEDVTRNKPHPEMLVHALREMGLPKEAVVFVGDSGIDIQTGKNAGVRVFAVATGLAPKEDLEKAQPARVLERLADLLDYV
jgi:HAD superfamily hydrolase (TIGR01549 family)